MVKTKTLNPLELNLDMANPRFSLFNFNSEDEVIEYLFKYEGVRELASQIIENGYLTLGERLIVKEEDDNSYTVLEGNRRIAALKGIFRDVNFLKAQDRKKSKKLNIRDFWVSCDIIDDVEERKAQYKISTKHIEGFTSWKPTNKRAYYDKFFSRYREKGFSTEEAIAKIDEITPETKYKIKKAIEEHRFLTLVYQETKKSIPKLDDLSHLDSDVLLSRVRRIIIENLNLHENNDLYLEGESGKEAELRKVLQVLGKITWVEKKLTTRTVNKKSDWNAFLNTKASELKQAIDSYLNKDLKMDSAKDHSSDDHSDKGKNETVEDISRNRKSETKKKSSEKNKKVNKYKLFVKEEKITVKKSRYNLLENIQLIDYEGNNVSKKSSIYREVQFSTENDNISINSEGEISEYSVNGLYKIIVYLNNTKKSFELVLNKPSRTKKIDNIRGEILFSDEWFEESIALLFKDEYKNIVSVIKSLNTHKYMFEDSSNVIANAILLRILIEYASKAYLNCFECKIPNGLSSIVNTVASDLYNRKLITKEGKKAINGKDLESLNAQIHDYKVFVSLTAVQSIFQAYQEYLSIIFRKLNEAN